jgi:copper chaperone
METLKFKTNIKCDGCIATVTPYLDAVPGLTEWKVDTAVPEKILTVTGANGSLTKEVVETLKKAGYQAEPV